jgi:hypothetical protein
VLGFADDPSCPAPAVEGGVEELLEPPGGLASRGMLGGGGGQVGFEFGDQARIAGEAEDIMDSVRSHQAISSSRAKPESARSKICTRGQACRIRSMIRATSWTAPAEASRFEGRSRAASKCRPQNT